MGLGAVGAGVASASPVLSLDQSTGLTDGQLVTVTVSGLAMSSQATVEISECGNAYADNTALPVVNMTPSSRDCEVLGFTSPGSLSFTSDAVFPNIAIKETGIGNGNRSCSSLGTAPCVVYVSESNNEGGAQPQSDISFAADALGAVPSPTEVSTYLIGAPIAVSKAAYAHVEVHRVGDGIVPEGSFSVSLDGGAPVTAAVGSDGTAIVPVAPGSSLALGGGHSIEADYIGDGSFASSSSGPVGFSVVGDLNISVGDGTVVNSPNVSPYRTLLFPIILSRPPTAAVTIDFSTADGTATAGTDYTALIGKTKFNAGAATAHYVAVRILPSASSGGTFTFNLSAPAGGLTGGYVFRRPVGTGTIIVDPLASGSSNVVNIGSASVPEGDLGGPKALKFSVTLSRPAATTFRVLFIVAADTATHKSKTNPGDWTGGVLKSVKFLPGQVNRTVAVATIPDLNDELDKTLTVDVIALCTTGTTVVQCTAHPAGVIVGQGHAVGTILSDE